MTDSAIGLARTLLFVPGCRPERFAKALAAQPDMVVLDLEDAVPAEQKDRARQEVGAWLAAGNAAAVRINGVGTSWHSSDLDLMAEVGAPVMLPKAEEPDAVADATRGGRLGIIALIETAAGVLAAPKIAEVPGVHRLAFGHIDFCAQLGVDPGDRDSLLAARIALVLASAAAGLSAPADGVTTALNDSNMLRDDIRYARRLGFGAKLCIHPAQVDVVHEAMLPSAVEVEWARRIVSVSGPRDAAVTVDGQMVDAPVVKRAQRILAAMSRN
ncbi:CoA ester lyase [Mycolicibacterium sp. 624]|uniref:HpcH/HpaI aldolase/citrate lyase family protein n=1 Tax=Mycolicibacterium sp. 624 TaxID=3156314 RepID=UPI003398A4AA